MPQRKPIESHTLTIVAAIVALVLIVAAAAIGLSLVGGSAESTPLVTAIIGIVAPTLVALLALLRTDTVSGRVDRVHEVVNGKVNDLENRVNAVEDQMPDTGAGPH